MAAVSTIDLIRGINHFSKHYPNKSWLKLTEKEKLEYSLKVKNMKGTE